MRVLGLSAVVLLLALSLVGIYACGEYERAGRIDAPNTTQAHGPVLSRGTVRDLRKRAEPGSNLALALADCQPDAAACVVPIGETGSIYLCVMANRQSPPAGPWVALEGQIDRFYLDGSGAGVHLLRECRPVRADPAARHAGE